VYGIKWQASDKAFEKEVHYPHDCLIWKSEEDLSESRDVAVATVARLREIRRSKHSSNPEWGKRDLSLLTFDS
jgi:hypothetical protein